MNFRSRQESREINGKKTEVLFQSYADRFLVLVTQLGKVGNLVHSKAYSNETINSQQDLDTSFNFCNRTPQVGP